MLKLKTINISKEIDSKKIKLPMMYLYKVIVRPNSRIKLSDKKIQQRFLF